ncbi:helix-turn-helix transcriptional regulator [Bacillus cereus]|uniref:helix-turn-helix transcriptional regulator n=1 Tax=Bacillus cereus TaxID=1396 RepID=UPI00187A11BE|nr:helix-turn-helix transcriptional regulator [Bacillus cereus]MBE7107029.1 helix-turn-helix transcriptional regulator [Bacillus cereus]
MKFNYNELKRLRVGGEMSQDQLGNLAGCTRSAISMMERGKCEPSRKTLISFSEIFKVSIDHFFLISTD